MLEQDVKEEGLVGEKAIDTKEESEEEADKEVMALRRDLCDAEWLALKVQEMVEADDRQIEKDAHMAMPVDEEVDERLAAEIADAVATPAAALSHFLVLFSNPTTQLLVLDTPKTFSNLLVLKLPKQIAFSLYRFQNSHHESIITNSGTQFRFHIPFRIRYISYISRPYNLITAYDTRQIFQKHCTRA